MQTVFLETQNVRAFQAAVAGLEDTDKGNPGLGVVWGRAGRGKTMCARQYAVTNGAIYLRVMQDWTAMAMLAALCFELQGGAPRSADAAKRQAIAVLESTQRVVLIDEADRLKPALIGHLRDLHDLSGAPVVLIGEEALAATMYARQRDWSRVAAAVEFGPVEAEDVALFARRACNLDVPLPVAEQLQQRAQGDFRLVYRDMAALERLARANQVRQIEAELLRLLPAQFSPKQQRRAS